MPEEKSEIDKSTNTSREQAKITAKKLIKSIEDSINNGYMSYPELIEILRHFLLQAMNEMVKYRFGMPTLSLKGTRFEKLYDALKDLEKKEQKKKKK